MIAADSTQEVVICDECGADRMGCDVKRGLGGRRCCDACTHNLTQPKEATK